MAKIAFVILATLFPLTGTAVAQEYKAVVQKIEDRMTKDLVSGDAKKAASIYSSDAVMYPAGEPAVIGHKDIEAWWIKNGAVSEAKFTTVEAIPMGDNYIRELGTYHIVTKEDKPQVFDGKYVVILHKSKSGAPWEIHTDIWNSDR